MLSLHRVLLAALLLGNTIFFAGVDPPTRLISAVLVLIMVVDLRSVPEIPRLHKAAAVAFGSLVILQLLPLPMVLRRLLQPGYALVMHTGWAPISLAPWATIQVAASAVVAASVALIAARMARTRTGLPALLAILAITGALLAVLGLAAEAGAPAKVLLVRDNTGGGGPYGPFVNRNHFAQAVELTIPAAVVLLAVAARHLRRPGEPRQRAAVVVLAASVTIAVSAAALLRCGSRGGALFLSMAFVVTLPWWRRIRGGRRWPWVVAVILIFALIAGLAWTKLPALKERFVGLLVIQGVDGNSRIDLWAGTFRSWTRAPLVGSGLGSYRNVIAMDRPATGTSVLEQAHNDWMEWLATTGVLGVVVVILAILGAFKWLRPAMVRRLRFEYRYPTAGLMVVLVATSLHESIGFGMQIPLNRFLLAAWLGLFWGVLASTSRHRKRPSPGEGSRGGE